MSEKNFWIYLRNGMNDHWNAVRIESSTMSGIPDIIYSMEGVRGFIELKYIKHWPKRVNTIIRLKHFTPLQRLFLSSHEESAGHCFIFLKIERDYLLFSAPLDVCTNIGFLRRKELEKLAKKIWHGKINFDELRRELI